MIRIFDLQNRVELGTLLDGEGSINTLAPCQTHILTGSSNGSISIWRVKDYAKLHTLKGPKSGILSLSLHPSERIALAGSKSGKLTLWNLVKGRIAFTTRLGKTVEEVQWSPCGLYYAVRLDREILVSAAGENAKHEGETLTHDTQLTSMTYSHLSEVLFAAGTFHADISGLILIYDTTTSKVLYFPAEDGRRITAIGYVQVKGVAVLGTLGLGGVVKLWNVTKAVEMVMDRGYETGQKIENRDDLLLSTHNLDCRCTSLCLGSLPKSH